MAAGNGAELARRLWPKLTARPADEPSIAALDTALALLIDHDLAASTLAARVAASAHAHPYAVVSAGLGVLEGPLHGAASGLAHRMLTEVLERGSAVPVVADHRRTGRRVPGLGHRLYDAKDPRARTLFDLLADIPQAAGALAAARDVVTTAARHAPLHANVDLALAVLSVFSGMAAEAGETVFAVSRTAYWIAHALERGKAAAHAPHRSLRRPPTPSAATDGQGRTTAIDGPHRAPRPTNPLHTLLGLLEWDMHEDAMECVTEVVGVHRATAEQATEKVRDPLAAALLVGKATVTAERGVALRVAPGTLLPDRLVDPCGLVTIVGDLVDDAMDAAAGTDGARAEVGLHTEGRTVVLRVRDSCPGVPAAQRALILTEGWSTKELPTHRRRGLGLALVRRLTERQRDGRRGRGRRHRVHRRTAGGPRRSGHDGPGIDRTGSYRTEHRHRGRHSVIEVRVVDDDIRIAKVNAAYVSRARARPVPRQSAATPPPPPSAHGPRSPRAWRRRAVRWR